MPFLLTQLRICFQQENQFIYTHQYGKKIGKDAIVCWKQCKVDVKSNAETKASKISIQLDASSDLMTVNI